MDGMVTAEGIAAQVTANAAAAASAATADAGAASAQPAANTAGAATATASSGATTTTTSGATTAAATAATAEAGASAAPAATAPAEPGAGSLLGQSAAAAAPDAAAPDTAPSGTKDAADMPIQDWSKVKLDLPAGGYDQGLVDSYGKQAVELGLTERQARTLAHWQLEETRAVAQARLADEQKKLDAAWGKDCKTNIARVETFCARLAREPGLEGFVDALNKSGAASNALVVQGLHRIASALGEDSAGRLSGLDAGPQTALEGIRDAFARARARRPE